LGYFYLDLFPREGKYSHAACFPIFIAYDTQNKRQLASSGMICNFHPPKQDKPSLLSFSEAKTFFHEFGHVMHSILSSSKFYRLNWNWSIVEQDFLEVPSMMFEKWVYYPEVTKQISGLYTNPLESLPDDLRERIIESKNVGFAILTRRLIFMSIFDLEIHSDHSRDSKEELSELWRNLLQKYYLPHELDTTPYSSWQHMTSGYNAGYYGYLWSEVFSYDLFFRI